MTGTRPLRSGIIGTGFMGRVHTRAVRAAGGEVVAYASRSAEGARAAAEQEGVALALSSEELVCHPDVDIVHICTPNSQHLRLALAALEAGKHVVCEKPLAGSSQDAERLAAAAKRAGVVHAVPFVYRYYPSVRDMRDRIASTQERIWLAHGHYLQDWLSAQDSYNWRIGDGESRAFADIGVHWCDLFEFTTGHRIRRLLALRSQLHETRISEGKELPVASEDAATVVFETDRGASGSVVISQASPGRNNALLISLDGKNVAYTFDQESPDTLRVGSSEHVMVVSKGVGKVSDSVSPYVTVPAGHPQGYQDCFSLFMRDVAATINGEPVDGLPTFEDGVRAAQLTDAVIESSRRGEWIHLPEQIGVAS